MNRFLCLLTVCTCWISQGQAQSIALMVTTSADLSKKWDTTIVRSTRAKNDKNIFQLFTNQRYQPILGFGGTFTEASAYNLKRISALKRNEVIDALFNSVRGAGWTMLRTTINSCDAASSYYSYDDVSGDTLLLNFSIQPDLDNYMIPGLQQIQKASDRGIKILASPWTPPVWMKDSGVFNRGSLLKRYYPTWALYFSKYLSAYQKHGIPIWAITPQNEPAAFQQAWDACGWTAPDMQEFINQHLGPRLKTDGHSVAIYGWDHNKNKLEEWADVLLQNKSNYVDGLAFHWYEEGEGKFYEPLLEVQRKYPHMPLIADEQGVFGLYLMDRFPAELYLTDLIENLNHGCHAWMVWGMCFDHLGGPNHAKNFNHSPIMIDVSREIIHYNPSYYYIGHASKYIQPGAMRVGFANPVPERILATVTQNPDGSLVVLLLNKSSTDEKLTLVLGRRHFEVESKAHSASTVILKTKRNR